MGMEERKQQEKEIRRSDIVNAAQKVFAEKGYRDATVDEIAKVAQFSKRTIYTYFLGKEHIYFELMIRGYRLLLELLDAELKEAGECTAVEELRRIFLALYRFSVKCPGYFQAIIEYETEDLGAIEGVPEEACGECYDLGEQLFSRLLRTLEKGKEDGSMPRLADANTTALVFWACAVGTFATAKRKARYLMDYHGVDAQSFLSASFEQLVKSVMA